MTNQQVPGSGIIDEIELAKRKQSLQDAYNFSRHIPDELRAQLEAGLSDEMRTAVLQLQILAIKYGRAIERQDMVTANQKAVLAYEETRQRRPSKLALQLVDKIGQPVHKVDNNKKVDILVAPGFLDLTKKH